MKKIATLILISLMFVLFVFVNETDSLFPNEAIEQVKSDTIFRCENVETDDVVSEKNFITRLSKLPIWLYTTLGLFAFLFIVQIIMSQKNRHYSESLIDVANNRVTDFQERLDRLEKDLKKSQETTILLSNQPKEIISQQKSDKLNEGPFSKFQEFPTHQENNQNEKDSNTENIIKYGNFAFDESTGSIEIENRDMLTDENEGWFKFEINPNNQEATYTINPKMEKQILSNLMQIAIYSEPFDKRNDAASIKIIRKGALVKCDRIWRVNIKIVIELN